MQNESLWPVSKASLTSNRLKEIGEILLLGAAGGMQEMQNRRVGFTLALSSAPFCQRTDVVLAETQGNMKDVANE